MIIINDSYSENQFNLLNDLRIIKIRDNDFDVLKNIDFITSKYDFIADIECNFFYFYIRSRKEGIKTSYFQ